MGIWQSIKDGIDSLAGDADKDLLAGGILARGEVTSVAAEGTTVQHANQLVKRRCTVGLKVYMDGKPPYDASSTQLIHEVVIPQMQQPGAVVAVRVDPSNPARVAIDFASKIPTVTLTANPGEDSAAWILANGKPVEVVVTGMTKLNFLSPEGHDVYGITLTVATGVDKPYQAQVGNAVPAEHLPLLFPGARLHARVGNDPGDVVVEWAKGPASAS
jgi:hypothetical protein